MMSPQPLDPAASATQAALASRERMSALADGEGDAAADSALWARDPAAREAWHAYHLIGDVLRSDDLAVNPARDADFLVRLRERLATEPAIVAPLPVAAAVVPRSRRRWAAPAAVAAGFVAVAGVLVMTRTIAPMGDVGSTLAGGSAAPQVLPSGATVVPVAGGSAAVSPAAAVEGSVQVVNGQLIRDARLDQYLRAHRNGPAAVPGGAIGRFETVVLER